MSSVLILKISVRPPCALCLGGESLLSIPPPPRHRARRHFTEKMNLGLYRKTELGTVENEAKQSVGGSIANLVAGQSFCRGLANDLAQRDIKRPVFHFDPSAHRNSSTIVCYPNGKLSLARKHAVGAKNLRVNAKCLDTSQRSLFLFLLNHLHRHLVNNTRIAHRDFKSSPHFKRLGP